MDKYDSFWQHRITCMQQSVTSYQCSCLLTSQRELIRAQRTQRLLVREANCLQLSARV